MTALTVEEIWRFPVKSLQGERLSSAQVLSTGIAGDRHWSIVDDATGKSLTARREPRLLFASARVVDQSGSDGLQVEITLPDGSVAADDAALSAWLGTAVTLTRASADQAGQFETQADDTETGDWFTWQGPEGSFHDSKRTRVSVVSRSTLRDWDSRRFRINVITDGDGEDDLVDQTLHAGTATLQVLKQIDRCVVTTRPQPTHAGISGPALERDLSVLKTINAERQSMLGIGALVPGPGTISVGDQITPT